MRDLFREGLRLGEELARLPWEAARRLTGKSETMSRAADLGEALGTLPFRTARRIVGAGARHRAAVPGTRLVPVRPGRGPAAGSRNRVVVLGAGYAGLTCFLELQDHLDRRTDLLLINSDQYHWFTTELHTFIAGEPEEAVRIPLSRIVAPPGRLRVDRVARIHPDERQVELESGERVPYDYLAFGLGSDPEYYGLHGVAENSLIVGNWRAAAELRNRVARLLDSAPDGSALPHVVIAGGGLTGVEVAGELADEHPGRLQLTIVEAGPEIMAGFEPHLVHVAHEVLEGKGIAIRPGQPISRVDPGMIQFKNGETLACDLLVWAGGVRGSEILARSGLAVTPRGRGKVDAFLRAEGHPAVYVIGDSAAFVDPATDREVPPSAQAAVQMGHTAGRNILRRIRGLDEQPFQPQIRGAFASLGRREGVGQIGKEQFSGLPAMAIKNLIEAHHAWETGGGVLPLVGRLIRGPQRFIRGRRSS